MKSRTLPFLDLYAVNRRHERAFFGGMRALYRRSAFVGGPWLEEFEAAFARQSGSPHCVGVGSGTSALHLSLAAAGIGPGDEVIVPAFTFPGTAWGVLYQGATPVFADVRLEDGCLDAAAAARAVTRRTKAVIAVHLFGHPAPLGALRNVARKQGLILIEDAAQAHGGAYGTKALGAWGDFGCFSFYPTKNLGGMGDSGAVLVRRSAWAGTLRRLRDHGQRRRFFPEEIGFNTRMDAVQALFLTAKLSRLKADNARRSAIAAQYLRALQGHAGLVPLRPGPEGTSAWHAFVVRCRNRKAFIKALDHRGIGHQVYYPAILPALKPFRAYAKGRFPVSEELARTALALPLHPGLTTADVARVVRCLRAV